jgi:hypothetical protein
MALVFRMGLITFLLPGSRARPRDPSNTENCQAAGVGEARSL